MYPIKLKIGILDHMNNTFRNTVLLDTSRCAFNTRIQHKCMNYVIDLQIDVVIKYSKLGIQI